VFDASVRFPPHDRLTCLALCLTVIGWAPLWAGALSLVALVPSWLAALLFFAGLALIPFRPRPLPGGALEGGR